MVFVLNPSVVGWFVIQQQLTDTLSSTLQTGGCPEAQRRERASLKLHLPGTRTQVWEPLTQGLSTLLNADLSSRCHIFHLSKSLTLRIRTAGRSRYTKVISTHSEAKQMPFVPSLLPLRS